MSTDTRNDGGPAAEADRKAFERAYADACEISINAVRSWRSDAFEVSAYRSSHAHAAWFGWKLARASRSSKEA